MKKIYTLISIFSLLGVTANAVTINVTMNANNTFTPNSFSAVVGDVVTWTNNGGTHTANSISTPISSVPVGAAPINSGTLSFGGTYSYTITTAGTYGYQCNLHGNLAAFPPTGMVGGFSVTTVGITEPVTNLITNAYPNPFKDQVTVMYTGVESIEVFNIVGSKVKAMQLSATENKAEIDFSGLPAGVYFYRTYKEGTIVETRKIVKAN